MKVLSKIKKLKKKFEPEAIKNTRHMANSIGKGLVWQGQVDYQYRQVWKMCDKFPDGKAKDWKWVRKYFFKKAKSGSALWLKNWLDEMIPRFELGETTEDDKIVVNEYFRPFLERANSLDFQKYFDGGK